MYSPDFTEGLWYAGHCDGSSTPDKELKSARGPLWQDSDSGKEDDKQES